MPNLYIEFRKQKDLGIVWSYQFCHIRFRMKFQQDIYGEVTMSMHSDVNVDVSVRNTTDSDDRNMAFSDDFHVIRMQVSEEELDRMYRLAIALKQLKTTYCESQLLYSFFFRVTDNAAKIETVKSLHNAQFVLVVIRECMENTNELKGFLQSINSLTTTPFCLFSRLFEKAVQLHELNVPLPLPIDFRSQGIEDFVFFDKCDTAPLSSVRTSFAPASVFRSI